MRDDTAKYEEKKNKAKRTKGKHKGFVKVGLK